MKTVYKYKLPLDDYVKIVMPKGAEIISVGEQEQELVIWAVVDSTAIEHRNKVFRIAGTGHPLSRNLSNGPDEKLLFIGTVQHSNGLVWHVFEVIPH